MKTAYNKARKEAKPKVDLFFKRIYVIAFNLYSVYWLFREIFIRETTNWEVYTPLVFAYTGIYFFVLRNEDIFFKTKR